MLRQQYSLAPSAARLTESLRDIGYDFSTATADIVDNSVAADARRVDIVIDSAAKAPRVFIADDGRGMGANDLNEALRFGSRRRYAKGDLGRYGLGLKTASLSQCRRLTVASRRSGAGWIASRQLDLDLVQEWDDWLVIEPRVDDSVQLAKSLLNEQMNTVVIWEKLDRALSGRYQDGDWSRRRLESLRLRAVEHLGSVFQRQIDGVVDQKVVITVNGEKVRSWDPFAIDEPATVELEPQKFEIEHAGLNGVVSLRRWILPPRHQFSSSDAFERLSGPLKWNRQQGLYIYRANRLVQWGGWAGLRAIDEHTKLARCSLDFDTDLDPAFNINVAKMRVSIPTSLRHMLQRPLHELCQVADDTYRRASISENISVPSAKSRQADSGSLKDAGLALLSAAIQAGHESALRDMAAVMRDQSPEIANNLGLDRL